MKVKKKFLQQEINDKINSLRFKLNEMYKIKGHIKEVVDISQELDKYIAIVQQELVKKINIY